MTQNRNYLRKDLEILYGLAAGRCSLPDCRRRVVLISAAGTVQQIGKIAHIVGHSERGPRGDPSYPRGKVDNYDNLVLLCPTCHDIVDAQEEKYSVDDLRRIKANHERWVEEQLKAEIVGVTCAELEVVTMALLASPDSGPEDFSLVPLDKKIIQNELTDRTRWLLRLGLSKITEVKSFVEQVSVRDGTFPTRLRNGFSKEYKNLRNSGLSGDSLFEAMRNFAIGGHLEFVEQAAGLAVLTYFFEMCEVFEK